MQGHVRQRGKGGRNAPWYGVYRVPGKKNPTWRRLEGAANKRQAEAALRAILSSMDQGMYVEPSRRTVSNLIDAYLASRENDVADGGLRASTLSTYRMYLTTHVGPGLGDVKVQRLTREAIEAFYKTLRERKPKPLAESSRRQIHVIVKNMLKWAVEERWIGVNPAAPIKGPKQEIEQGEGIKKSLTDAELTKFVEALEGEPLADAFLISLHTGMRRGELAAIQWGDVDLDAGTVRVERSADFRDGRIIDGPPKTRNAKRKIHLAGEAIEILRRLQSERKRARLRAGSAWHDDPQVFVDAIGRRVPLDTYSRDCTRIMRAAGIKGRSLLNLRHTHLSRWSLVNQDPATLYQRAGHHSPAFTLKVYVERHDDEHAKQAANFGSILPKSDAG